LAGAAAVLPFEPSEAGAGAAGLPSVAFASPLGLAAGSLDFFEP
jgi:hypothetical protein